MPHPSPEAAVLALTDPAAPYLIGVRHHAPSWPPPYRRCWTRRNRTSCSSNSR
ncbi:hypothetical protein O1M54_43315 [Streptomyces diastatochromogenes]|nr:hypothetical protein [Streptomyces diastatochromogenes]